MSELRVAAAEAGGECSGGDGGTSSCGVGSPAFEVGVVVEEVGEASEGEFIYGDEGGLVLVSAPSLTVSVRVAVPVCMNAGVTVTVRFAPLPPMTMLLSGTSWVLEDATLILERSRGSIEVADGEGNRGGAGV